MMGKSGEKAEAARGREQAAASDRSSRKLVSPGTALLSFLDSPVPFPGLFAKSPEAISN
jgi:hypothetical protein